MHYNRTPRRGLASTRTLRHPRGRMEVTDVQTRVVGRSKDPVAYTDGELRPHYRGYLHLVIACALPIGIIVLFALSAKWTLILFAFGKEFSYAASAYFHRKAGIGPSIGMHIAARQVDKFAILVSVFAAGIPTSLPHMALYYSVESALLFLCAVFVAIDTELSAGETSIRRQIFRACLMFQVCACLVLLLCSCVLSHSMLPIACSLYLQSHTLAGRQIHIGTIYGALVLPSMSWVSSCSVWELQTKHLSLANHLHNCYLGTERTHMELMKIFTYSLRSAMSVISSTLSYTRVRAYGDVRGTVKLMYKDRLVPTKTSRRRMSHLTS